MPPSGSGDMAPYLILLTKGSTPFYTMVHGSGGWRSGSADPLHG